MKLLHKRRSLDSLQSQQLETTRINNNNQNQSHLEEIQESLPPIPSNSPTTQKKRIQESLPPIPSNSPTTQKKSFLAFCVPILIRSQSQPKDLDDDDQNIREMKEARKKYLARNLKNVTPLHAAVWDGNLEVVRFLLMRGSDVNAQDFAGQTPLHIAAAREDHSMIELLLSSGADKEIKDKAGLTVSMIMQTTLASQ